MQLQRHRIKLSHHSIGWPRAFRWRGSVLSRVAIPVFILAAWATIVALWQTSPFAFFWPTSTIFLTIISFVLSLLLGFRTNTAYERYWEGRKLWSNLTVATRNMSRLIWIAADSQPHRDNITEKTTALSLLLSFLIAVRNHARGNLGLLLTNGSVRPEFKGLLPPKLQLTSKHPYLLTNPKLVHADILYLLNAYIDDLFRRKCLDAPQCTQIINIINNMNDTVTSIERILTTPIPLAYNIHLKQIMYMYLFMLPFQLIGDHKFISILITALATFTFVGVELIGSEIENPFGIDDNDLPIEEYIADLEVELSEILYTQRTDLADWALNNDDSGKGTDITSDNSDELGGTTIRVMNRIPTSNETNNPLQNPDDSPTSSTSSSSTSMGLVTILGIAAIGNRVIHSSNMTQSMNKENNTNDMIEGQVFNGITDNIGAISGGDE